MPALPVRINAAIAGLVVAVDAAAFFMPVTAPWSLVLLVLLGPMQWGLVHEAIHGMLIGSSRRNRVGGRVLAILLGYSFDLVRFGHLMHHAETGHGLDRPDQGGGRAWLSVVRHYGHLLGGHYVVTALAPCFAFLPWRVSEATIYRLGADAAGRNAPVRDAALRWFGQARRRAAIRTDVVAAFAVLAAALWLYGALWPWLAVSLYGRALLLSVLDNMPHYGTDGRDTADIPLFRIPRALALPVMNHHLHRLHHDWPNLPWNRLPRTLDTRTHRFDDGYLAAILRQFRGPNWARAQE